MSHHCPICQLIVARREVKTCGGIDCIAQWKLLTSAQKARFIEIAESRFDNLIERHLPQTPEIDPKLKELLSPPTLDPAVELEKIFGSKKKEGDN